MSKKVEYRLKHIGINNDDEQCAAEIVAKLCNLFNVSPGAENDTHAFAGSIFEVMKNKERGKCGHIALQVDDVEEAMDDLRTKGISFKEDTIRRDENGKIVFAYFQQEIGGFAFHLTL